MPEAPGLSGSGLWTVKPKKDAIWSPDHAQLVAVQRSWSENKRYLRGTLVREWLKMLREDIPSLASKIDPILATSDEGVKVTFLRMPNA